MVPQLFLITPQDTAPEALGPLLMATLSAAEVSAILVRRGGRDDAEYAACVERVVNIGQGAGVAVLVEDDPALARRTGADGVHVTGGLKAVREAIAALKPDLIVGAGGIRSRHDAMTLGELEVDYVFFGTLDGDDPQASELGAWWAATFEVPAVVHMTVDGAPDAHGAEFLALSTAVWSTPSPAETVRAIATALKAAA